MAEEAKNPPTSNLGNLGAELDAALTTLESVLGSASHAVAGIRDTLPQIAALGEVVAELEAAMSSAYRHLSAPVKPAATPPTPTMLRPVPPSEPEPETIESTAPLPEAAQPIETAPAPEAAPLSEPAPAPEAESAQPVPTIASPEAAPSAEAEPEPEAESAQPVPEPIQLNPETTPSATLSEGALDSPASDSLQLSISATSGSLDLKAVDRSINEIPAVVDVTLLDYDGRNATLKIWTTETADPAGVKEALLESFRRNFGDGQDTEISIDLEGEQA